jgi:hypothetical protein
MASAIFLEESDHAVEAKTIDVSPSGMRVRVNAALTVGRVVKIQIDRYTACAEVRFCRVQESGLIEAGLQILAFERTV